MDQCLGYSFLLLFILLMIIFGIIYLNHTKDYCYWQQRCIPNREPSFPFGSIKDIVLARTYIGKCYDKMYNEFSSERFFGIIEIQTPVLVLRDPDLVKAVLIKDFNYFSVRTNTNPKEFILQHVINMNGQEWRKIRTLLTPAFTTGKMKSLHWFLVKCSAKLNQHLNKITEETPVVEVTNLLARFTLDGIASCAFGIETDSINNPNCEFFVTVGKMLRTTKSRFAQRFLTNVFPSLVKMFPVKIIPSDVTRLLLEAVKESVTYREKHNEKRNDFLDVMIKTRKNKSDLEHNFKESSLKLKATTGLSVQQMTAQAFAFFIAGYTTGTSIMSFCLYELSRNKYIQEKVFQEIHQAMEKHGCSITYAALQDMTYLDQVVLETLRLYGSGQTLTRVCTKPYNIPGTDTILERGIKIVIPTYSLHHDHTYFQNPYEFQPERFTLEKIKERHPCVFLPFGKGPRNCIGQNFGMLQMKIGLATIISSFFVSLRDEDKEQKIEIDKKCIVVTPANPVYLQFLRRK